jgi:cycloartenol synthase
VATGVADAAAAALRRAHGYVRNTQVVDEAAQPLARYYRHISVGAWPFSTRDHGWPISDCTSEARAQCSPAAEFCMLPLGARHFLP